MRYVPSPNDSSFLRFRCQVISEDFVATLANCSAWEPEAMRVRLGVALGEAAQTLRLLCGLEIPDDARLIEIGAGLGLASAYLSLCGFSVVSLEPAAIGFDEHTTVARHIAELVGSTNEVYEFAAEELNPETHGKFSLIFSNNVLEHVHDLGSVMRSLGAVLSVDGVMIHSCANYSIPFEPHFGIPLLPFVPQRTERILTKSIAESDVWKSLNFVTARKAKKVAAANGLSVAFRAGALAASIERLGRDAEFGARHSFLRPVGNILVASKATKLIKRLPATWATPMDFIVSGQGADRARISSWLSSPS